MTDRLLTPDEVLAVLDLGPSGSPHFPTFTVCPRCYGSTGWYSPRTGSVHNRTAANQLRLLQHGYYLAKWEGRNVGNSRIIPHPCTCECDHAWVDGQSRAMFDHETVCTECGASVRYDSSD